LGEISQEAANPPTSPFTKGEQERQILKSMTSYKMLILYFEIPHRPAERHKGGVG